MTRKLTLTILLNLLFVLSIGAAVTATLLEPNHIVTHPLQISVFEIGRASCRERVSVLV